MNRLLPRLDREAVDSLLDELSGLGVTEIAAAMPAVVPVTYAPLGGVRAEAAFLLGLRERILSLARLHGYPDARRQGELHLFDAAGARLLHDDLSITPHEAGHREVWAAFTAANFLDVAVWRWGKIRDRARVNGDVNRDTFRRLWWRAELLVEPDSGWDVLAELGEDEIQAVTERPIVTGNPIVARSIVGRFRAHLTSDNELEPIRMYVMREAMKRLTRLTPFIALDVLERSEIDHMVDGVFRESIRALTGRDSLHGVFPPLGEHSPGGSDGEEAGRGMPRSPLDAGPPGLAVSLDRSEVADVALGIAARAGRVTNMMLRDASGLDDTGARQVLAGLVDRGLLEQRGERRGSHYVLVHHAATSVLGRDLGPTGRVVGSLRRAIARSRGRD